MAVGVARAGHAVVWRQVNGQLSEAKKKADDDTAELEEVHSARRRLDKDMEALQEKIEELTAENAKVQRSKKKLQGDVSAEASGRGSSALQSDGIDTSDTSCLAAANVCSRKTCTGPSKLVPVGCSCELLRGLHFKRSYQPSLMVCGCVHWSLLLPNYTLAFLKMASYAKCACACTSVHRHSAYHIPCLS